MAHEQHQLTDEQWARLRPLLAPQKPRTGRLAKDHRTIVEAIAWLGRTGGPWRDLPGEYGPWHTIASRFYRRERQGIWERRWAALQAQADARGELGWLLHLYRQHEHLGASARGRGKGGTRRGKHSAAAASGSAPNCR